MQDLLENIIETGNPELISKYIDKYLPNDAQNLERIYNELSRYDPTKKDNNGKQLIQAVRQIKKQPRKKFNQTPLQASIRKSKSMVNFLRQKGFQATQDAFQKGLVIAQKQKQKFLKPLKMNPITPFLKKGKINKLCQKYELNKQFYQNPPAGFQPNYIGFDPDMFNFIQKRKQVLRLIQQKKANEVPGAPKTKKYENISSKIKSTQSTNLNDYAAILKLSQSQTLSKQQLKFETKSIIEKCNNFYKIKSVPKQQQNYFKQLKQKINLLDDIDIDEALRTKANQKIANQKLQRYNLPYMTYLKQKKSYRSMSSLKKQLMKDQIKMRGIVNFQD